MIPCMFIGFLIFFAGTAFAQEYACPDLDENLDGKTQEQFINLLTDPCRYDKLIKPNTAEPLPVYLQINLNHLESSDNIQFSAYMVVQYQYKDNRLNYSKRSPNRKTILGEDSLKDKIWIPKLIIRNDKDISIRGIEGSDVFLSISPEGDVLYSYRITATFYCFMDLRKFPFDSQQCNLTWSTWTYNTTNLVLHWAQEDAVIMSDNLHLTEFILDETASDEVEVDGVFSRGHLVGTFNELRFTFKLTRQIGYYMMDYFLPSIMLVCTSWVTFWLQADATPPRATFGTSTVIAFITLNVGLDNSLPKVSYVKATDIWSLAIYFFIFGSLAEFAFVNVIWRRKKQVELKKLKTKYILKGAIAPSAARREVRDAEFALREFNKPSFIEKNDQYTENFDNLFNSNLEERGRSEDVEKGDQTYHKMSPQELAIWVDRKARIVFPVAFVIFNIFYWSFVYLL